MIKTSIIDPELALKIVRNSPEMAYDTETSGLSPGFDFICGHVMTDWEHSVYVPLRHEPGGNVPNADEFEKELNDAFAERQRLNYKTVFHNGGFDLRMCSWHGITIMGNLEDTMINESLIDDTTDGWGLDDCSARHQVTVKRGAELYRAIAERFGGIPDKKQMGNFWRMPGDDFYVVDYATGDGVSTLELWRSQQAILDAEELRQPWRLECELMQYLPRLHRRGIKIDPVFSENIDSEIDASLKEAKSVFADDFNARGPKDVEALYRANGYTDGDFNRTPAGKPSFTEKWLETNEIGEKILDVRRLEKMRDSFVAPLVRTKNINGRVHPTLNQSKSDEYGVAGARLSCSDPNMQAFPKRNMKVGAIVRKLVVADDGMLLEEGDAMQQEPRFFTHYSGDEALRKGYSEDLAFSIHQRANDMMFGGQDYDKAKRMAMGILSMMGTRALANHLSISMSEAGELKRKFLYGAFPDIGVFQELAVEVFKQRGFVKSILGRRARLENPKYAYQAVSRIIQNSGGDHNKTCLLRACQYEDAYPDKIQILLPIHDSIIWQRDPSHDVKEFVGIMENVPHEPQFDLSIPIPFEVGSGNNWAEASYTHKIPGNGRELKGKKGWTI